MSYSDNPALDYDRYTESMEAYCVKCEDFDNEFESQVDDLIERQKKLDNDPNISDDEYQNHIIWKLIDILLDEMAESWGDEYDYGYRETDIYTNLSIWSS